jgi:hypothetical protein
MFWMSVLFGLSWPMIVLEKIPKGYVTLRDWRSVCWSVVVGLMSDLQIVEEPSQAGADHRLPVSLDDQQIRHISFDSMLAILCRFDHSNSEEKQADWKDKAQPKADTPDTRRDSLVVAFEHNQGDDTCHYETKVDGEVCRNGDKKASLAADVFAFIRCFC